MHGDAALHVDGAAAAQHAPPVDPAGRQVGSAVRGTVSMWPASTTRSSRPRSVRATTVLPIAGHLEVREVAQRGLDGIREGCSSRLTDSMSHTAAVSEVTSVVRSRAVVVDGIPVTCNDRARPSTLVAMTRTAWGHGLLTLTDDGTVLDAWFPSPALGRARRRRRARAPPPGSRPSPGRDEARAACAREVRLVTADLDAPPADTADGWLRLHLLSHRLVAPNTISLDGLFGVLTNVVWTSQGPCAVEGFELTRVRMLRARHRCRCSASTSSRG